MHGTAADERVGWRFATAADIDAYYGERPQQTVRAVAITLNDEVAAIIGIARHFNHARFFSEFRPQLRPHLRTFPVMRALKTAQAMIHESRLPVYAIAEETEPDATRILMRLGFILHEENIYLWPNSQRSSPT